MKLTAISLASALALSGTVALAQQLQIREDPDSTASREAPGSRSAATR